MAYEELKDRIRETPISSILTHYISLQKRGASFLALCPFHSDSKPSLTVTDSKGMFKCFACGAGGDAIKFVCDFTKVEFVEALKDIAGKIGLPFEEYKKTQKKNPRMDMAVRVLDAANKIYQKVAEQKNQNFVDFVAKRKFLPETIEKFQIGYAPGNNVLRNYLETIPSNQKPFAFEVAQELHIIRQSQNNNSLFDFFRDRVMFPIHDHQGQIRGFSGRAVLENQQNKYFNSVESFAFNKRNILFGLHFAKSSIRQKDQVIIVEGHIDVIMMHQFGFDNTVGTMGTAMSEQTIRLLANMTKNIFVGMDSDTAGKKAAARINQDLMGLGILAKYLSYEPAKDPDDFLLSEGGLALTERMEKAPILLDVFIQDEIPEKIPENLEVKLQILHRVYEILSPLKEHLAASERVVETAKRLGLKSDPATILQEYKEFLASKKDKVFINTEKPKLLTREEEISQEEQMEEELKTSVQESGPISKPEKVFIREMICHPEFLTQVNRDEFLAYISHNEVKNLFQWLVKIYFEIDEAEYVPIVHDHLNEAQYSKELQDIVTEALYGFGNRLNEKVIKKLLEDYLKILQLDQLKLKRRELSERQKTSHTQIEVDQIIMEITKIDKEIFSFKK